MERISKLNLVHRFEKRALLIAINCAAALSIFFFGYDQGVMGGINTSRSYVDTMNIGHWNDATKSVIIDRPTLQGGIIAVYYLPGSLLGAFLGGYIGDRFGRINTIAVASVWAIIGACLQCSAQNSAWMICARIFNGIGTGILNAITPVWATETAEHTSRGQFIAIEFTLNIFGVVVAYWIEYGISFYGGTYLLGSYCLWVAEITSHDIFGYGTSDFIWRFPIAFQIAPLLLLLAIVFLMPESPRWLVKVGREDEARYILGRLRGESGDEAEKSEAEFQDIRNICELERKTAKQQNYIHMFFGIGSGKLHTGRRVQLVVWLQIMQEWIGILGITVYGPKIFEIAGIAPKDQLWVTGLNDITYMLSTLVCVFTLDRIGRRWTLYWGSVGMGTCIFLVGGLSRVGQNAPIGSSTKTGAGIAATFFVFLFTAIFGATWLTVPWLYPAEIFPLEIRAKGNAWGVVGWSIGNGWLGLLCPVMFAAIAEKTLYVFGLCNVLAVPLVWALYPETNGRTLEDMDLVFAAATPWAWDAESTFAILKEEEEQGRRGRRRNEGLAARGVGDGGEEEERRGGGFELREL